MNNVFVDMEKLKSPNSGLAVFCRELGRALIRQKSDFRFSFFVHEVNKTAFGESANYIVKPKKWFPLSQNPEAFSIWHCTHQDSSRFPKNPTTKVVLTIHDLNYRYKYSGVKRIIKDYLLQKRINKAHTIVYISEFTKQEVNSRFVLPKQKQYVVYNGCTIGDERQKPHGMSYSQKYFFSLGIVNAKKNTHCLPHLLKHFPDHVLIIAGQQNHEYVQKIKQEAAKHNVLNRVLLIGEITDAEKCWLYEHCSAFFFPSLAEGFGLPVVEAMHFGRPIFLSTKTALPEIGGDVCYYWASFDEVEMLSVLKQGLQDYQQNPNHSFSMKMRAQQFSWNKAAEQYIAIYNELLS